MDAVEGWMAYCLCYLIRLLPLPAGSSRPIFQIQHDQEDKEHQVMNPVYNHDKALDHGHIGQDNTSGIEQSNGTQRNARI